MQSLLKVKKKKVKYQEEAKEYLTARETQALYSGRTDIQYQRVCNCKPTHINCQTPKEWIKSQLGVWQFTYEKKRYKRQNATSSHFSDFSCKKSNRSFQSLRRISFRSICGFRNNIGGGAGLRQKCNWL